MAPVEAGSPRAAVGVSTAPGESIGDVAARVRAAGTPTDPRSLIALVELTARHLGTPGPIWRALDRWGDPLHALRATHDAGPRGAAPAPRRGSAAAGAGDAIPYWDADYPARCWHLPDPPPLLFCRGDRASLRSPCLAIVGTRRCSEYGRRASEAISAFVGSRGIVVVSGLAEGIDAAAHRAALGTGTVAVLGCGLDVAYPRGNRSLRDSIARAGLLVSEFPPGTQPLPFNFPRRNRIIAAVSQAVVVVEAPHRSGAQNTVTHALDLGLEVGTVPGPIDSPSSAGSNRLLREGAVAITRPQDALDLIEEALAPGLFRPPTPGHGEAESPSANSPRWSARTREDRPLGGEGELCRALGAAPERIDDLAARVGLSAAAAASGLMELELLGLARRWPGGRYSRP
ncbi:MAG: DNA-processing protein DprA [Gemmatimonadota bacterium]